MAGHTFYFRYTCLISLKIEHKGKNKLCTDGRLNSTVSNEIISDDMLYSILVNYSTETSVMLVCMHSVQS